MMKLSITFAHHEKFPPTYQKSYFLKHYVVQGNAYRSSCTGVFYENKCYEKCSENSHIQRLREDSFLEPERG